MAPKKGAKKAAPKKTVKKAAKKTAPKKAIKKAAKKAAPKKAAVETPLVHPGCVVGEPCRQIDGF